MTSSGTGAGSAAGFAAGSAAGPAATWRRDALAVLLVALLASITGIGNGFTYDDIPVLLENPMVQEWRGLGAYLTDSYWGPSRGNALYRPVTIIAFAAERVIGGGSPLPFHVANILLYAVAALAAWALARLLLGRLGALVAGLAFAAHPVHVEAVANIVGQSEMLAGIPMLAAVALYARDRAAGDLRGRTLALLTACAVLALLAKEHGIVLPALLLLAEGVLGRDWPAAPAARRWQLARILALVVTVYVVVRISILGGFAGDAPHPALEGRTMLERAWVMLALVPEFVRLLLWPARLLADYSPRAIPFLTEPAPYHLVGAALLAALGALLAWAWRRDRVTAFALLWIGLTLGPVSNLLIATGVLVAERTLFLPSVGLALLLGRAAEALVPRLAVHPAPWVRRAVPAIAVGVLVLAVLRSADRQRDWEDNATLFATTVVDAPDNFRAHHALGELFGAAGAWARAEEHLRIADSLFPGYDLLELSLARVLHFDDRCPEALPLYTRVLERRGEAEIASLGRAACLLETRELSAARAEAVAGIARGLSTGSWGLILQKAESSLVATDTVDARNRWYRAGAPFSRSDARLRVPVLMMRPAGTRIRGRMPESSPNTPSPD